MPVPQRMPVEGCVTTWILRGRHVHKSMSGVIQAPFAHFSAEIVPNWWDQRQRWVGRRGVSRQQRRLISFAYINVPCNASHCAAHARQKQQMRSSTTQTMPALVGMADEQCNWDGGAPYRVAGSRAPPRCEELATRRVLSLSPFQEHSFQEHSK